MSLAGQAIRMLRTKWGERADLLAEELYTILLTDKDPETGPITVTFPDGTPSIPLPPGATLGPLGDLQFPDLIFPDLVIPQAPLFEENEPEDAPTTLRRVRSQPKHERVTVPGLVTAAEGSSHTVLAYPYGKNGQTSEGSILQEALFGASTSITAEELNGQTIPVGTYVNVFRHIFYIVEVIEIVEKKAGGEENVISTQTEIRVVSQNNEIAGGGAGGGSAAPAKIISGGPGVDYTAEIYTNGTGADPITASIKQLDIDASETIPTDTWVIAIKVSNQWYCQVPVWM